MADLLQVLFVAGWGRSGSTLIGQVLGGSDPFVHIGELVLLWEHSVLENRQCGCGLPFNACPFWTDVLDKAFPTEPPDACALAGLGSEGVRMRHALQLMFGSRRSRILERMRPYVDAQVAVYRAAHDRSGARVVVDTSKSPAYGDLIGSSPEVDVRVVHLVRDPGATAWAWRHRAGHDDDASSGRSYMPRIGMARSSLMWSLSNLMVERRWGSQPGRYLRVRYEDFVQRPNEVMRQITAFAGVPEAELPFVDGRTLDLPVIHTSAGNPIRFAKGELEISERDEWRDKLSRREAAVVDLMTGPFLARYSYPWRRRR